MKNKIVSIISLSIILQWLSLFFSYQKLSQITRDLTEPFATGGFPLKIFEYPVPPMGHDWPPAETWPMFFLNLLLWLILSFFILFFIKKDFFTNKKSLLLFGLACFFTLIGIFYLMLLFD